MQDLSAVVSTECVQQTGQQRTTPTPKNLTLAILPTSNVFLNPFFNLYVKTLIV